MSADKISKSYRTVMSSNGDEMKDFKTHSFSKLKKVTTTEMKRLNLALPSQNTNLYLS